ncbi:MAG: DUF58 domain-containing protein [Thiobacillaceae bacterium]
MQLAWLPVRNQLTRRLFGLEAADTLPVRLTARRVYILPSRAGLVFLALLGGMLLASVNYALAMGYLFTFLLLGLTSATLFATWRNLTGISLQSVASEPAFAGDTLSFTLELADPQGLTRQSIGVAAVGAKPGYTAIPASGSSQVVLRMPARRRGRQRLGLIRVYSEYPLGLFHAWALLQPDCTGMVWPQPAGPYPLPQPTGQELGNGSARRRGAEDFDGLRAYERGENPARIAWKSMARHEEPLAKGFVTPLAVELWLDWHDLGGLAPEARLSQLARWVLEAERVGRPYGLRLPGQSLPPGVGPAHRNRCLNALALVRTEGA